MRALYLVVILLWTAGCSGGEPTQADGSVPRRTGIDWRTEATLFRAAAIEIDAGGKQFTVVTDAVQINPGMANPVAYTTLEAIWLEHGVEMRVNVYLHSDGTEWWSDEIRHYDGAAQGDWITYKGDFFRSPVGMPFEGDLTVGTLVLHDVFMTSFLGVPCNGAAYSISAYRSVVEVPVAMNAAFLLPADVRDTSCAPIGLPAGTTIEWTTDDPAIATVVGMPAGSGAAWASAGEFKGVSVGSTMATIRMLDASSVELARQRLAVIAFEPPL